MCGIFGIINYGPNTYLKSQAFRDVTKALLKESQMRGRDASGLCVVKENAIRVFKDDKPADRLITTLGYSDALKFMKISEPFRSMIGHTRAETKGSHTFNVNNHPIIACTVIGVHNGMIWNDDTLFERYKDKVKRAGRVDSEIIFRLIDMHLSEGKSIVEATKATGEEIRGSFACAFVTSLNPRYVTLFRNAGSPTVLYHIPTAQTYVFASTEYILNNALSKQVGGVNSEFVEEKMTLPDSSGVRIDTFSGKMFAFDFKYSTLMQSVGAAAATEEQCPYDGRRDHCGSESCDECVYMKDLGTYGGF